MHTNYGNDMADAVFDRNAGIELHTYKVASFLKYRVGCKFMWRPVERLLVVNVKCKHVTSNQPCARS